MKNRKANQSVGWGKQSRGRDQDMELDRFIIQGYDDLEKGDHAAACNSWGRVWDHFLLRLSLEMESCQQTLSVYDGSFVLSNWLQDYCAALHYLALKDEAMAGAGVSFCSQVLLQFPKEEESIVASFRASMGEFLFLDNKPAEGEKVLAELISSLPHKAIGYACMAEMFSDSKFNAGQDNPLDLAQAIGYLERCLAFPAEDAADFDIEKRLAALKGEA